MVGDGGMDGGKLLKTSYAPETEHRPLPSSERKVRVLSPIVEPATCFLAVRRTDALPVARPNALNPALPDLGCEHRTKPMPPVSDRLVADLNAALVQQIFNIPELQREPDAKHLGQADNLRARSGVFEGAGGDNDQTPAAALPGLRPISPDKTTRRHLRLGRRGADDPLFAKATRELFSRPGQRLSGLAGSGPSCRSAVAAAFAPLRDPGADQVHIRDGSRGEKRLGIGMTRVGEDLLAAPLLHRLALRNHHDLVGDVADD